MGLFPVVMAGLVPAIHVFDASRKTWMPGIRPGMTSVQVTVTANHAAC
jgi:hypothetical protein